MKAWLLNKILGFCPLVGDKIHLHSIQGIYEIVEINNKSIKITCNKWKRSGYSEKEFPLKDAKCFAGDYLLYRITNKINTNVNVINR